MILEGTYGDVDRQGEAGRQGKLWFSARYISALSGNSGPVVGKSRQMRRRRYLHGSLLQTPPSGAWA